MPLPHDQLSSGGFGTRRFDLRSSGPPLPVFGMCGGAGVGPVTESAIEEWMSIIQCRDALHAAMQLQRDACLKLMASNLTVLQQYAISLLCMSTDILHSIFGREYFPSGAVDDATPVPCVYRASTHMAAMGLWRPLLGPVGSEPDNVDRSETRLSS